MIARLAVFLTVAACLGVVGEWGLAGVGLLGLVPGVVGLVASLVFGVALLVSGHYLLGTAILGTTAAVFWISNPQLHRSHRRLASAGDGRGPALRGAKERSTRANPSPGSDARTHQTAALALRCPSCGLVNPAESVRCDCGFPLGRASEPAHIPQLDLQINDVSFRLGDLITQDHLRAGRFAKAGFLTRLASAAASDQTLYWSKNCYGTLIDGRVAFSALREKVGRDPSFLCGTSAYLFFGPLGLETVTIQLFGSRRSARALFGLFTYTVADRIGEPAVWGERVLEWELGDTSLSVELSRDASKCWVVWRVSYREILR